MNRDLVSPLNTDDESFPCPSCGGGGRIAGHGEEDGFFRVVSVNCPDCGGSGYGPPPPTLDREVSHCLQRLAAWAHRDIPKEET